jgi:hypothetical protein
VESGFKEDVVGNLTKVLGAAADKLGAVLGSYYQAVLRGLVADFKARSDELEAAIRGAADLDLPMHLVEGGSPDPDEQKRKRLLAYADLRDKHGAADARLAKTCA